MFLFFNLSAKGFWDFLVGIQLILKPKRLVVSKIKSNVI